MSTGNRASPSPLTDLQQRFAAEMAADPRNATAAYIRAGGAVKTAKQCAHDLLKKPQIRAAIAEAQRESLERTGLSADMLLLANYEIAFADPRELSELRRTNCHYCWGLDHKYQWTPAEFARALAKVEQQNLGKRGKRFPLPECDGGTNYDRTRAPNPECPECRGEGHEREFFHDTRNLSPQAARLFAGVRRTKDGIEVLMQSQEKARDVLNKHHGLVRERVELTGKDGAPIELDNKGYVVAPAVAASMEEWAAQAQTPSTPDQEEK